MGYFPVWLNIGLRISVGSALVYAIVSRLKVDGTYAAVTILKELQDRQFRDGNNDWVDIYEVGKQLSLSTRQVRAALFEFEEDRQIDVVIGAENHVALGIRGLMMPRPQLRQCRHVARIHGVLR
jgi:hypothetical protein